MIFNFFPSFRYVINFLDVIFFENYYSSKLEKKIERNNNNNKKVKYLEKQAHMIISIF